MATEKFSDIPVRINGQIIDASWFNTLRTLLTQIFGDIAGEKATVVGNADTNQDVLGLVDITNEEFSRVDVKYMLRRKDNGGSIFQSGTLYLHYKESIDDWVLVGDEENILGDDGLLSFSVLTQVAGSFKTVTLRYSTTDLGGGGVHTGDLKVKSEKWVI